MVDFPSFFARYPFIDSADESVDGGVADKIGDDDRVSFLDRSVLRWWREVFVLFRFMMLVSFGGRLVRSSVRGLLRDIFHLPVVRVSCSLSVGYALSDAINRVL